MPNELVKALEKGVKALRKLNNKGKIEKGDPIIITMGPYGIVYEGQCTCGVESVKEMTDPHTLIFAEPQGWTFIPKDLHRVKKSKLSPNVMQSLHKGFVISKINKLGYCWVLKAKIILPK